jgi:hypothetical protein
MNPLLLAVLLSGPPGFHASDQAPLDREWSRFLSYRRSQAAWVSMYSQELGMCIDRAMCLGYGERVYEVDTPPGYEVEAIVAFAGPDSQAGRLLVELPVEMTGDPKARTHLAVFTGEVDSLIVLRRGQGESITLREEKR